MKELYEKLSNIISELLLYNIKVVCIYKPIFIGSNILINILDSSGNKKEILISHSKISKLHDHLLELYIFEIFRDNNLL